ncbi:hypothetical protein BASA83_009021 [Batrachochytrium salamandrivorans]|nr:hypothetical protein BASA83_009021 [Batrachochytrium salamandrivorans]
MLQHPIQQKAQHSSTKVSTAAMQEQRLQRHHCHAIGTLQMTVTQTCQCVKATRLEPLQQDSNDRGILRISSLAEVGAVPRPPRFETAISASSIASTALIYELDEQRRIASLPCRFSFQFGGIPQHYLPTHPLTALPRSQSPLLADPKHWSDPSQDFHRDGKSLNWHDGSAHFQLLDHRSSSSGSKLSQQHHHQQWQNNSINRRGTSMPCLGHNSSITSF